MSEDKSVLEMLEEDMHAAFRDFAATPTNSGRVKLRHKLLTLAGAMDVEAEALDGTDAIKLTGAIAQIRELAEVALVAPKEAFMLPQDNVVQKPVAPVKVAPPPKKGPSPTKGLGKAILRDIFKLFK